MVSVECSPEVEYPDASGFGSPDVHYPEYPFEHLAPGPNRVYKMVRSLVARTGWDSERYGTAGWNPLGAVIPPGAKVFVLCNFVYHRRPQESSEAFLSKCIHASVLRPILDYALIAAGPTGEVSFGNAPLQSCDWQRVLRETGVSSLLGFYDSIGAGIRAQDLRLLVTERDVWGRTKRIERRDGRVASVEIDLGADSLLAAVGGAPGRKPRYRVSDYDPRRTEAYHAEGSHRYAINRAVLEADVVISLSKLKTHEKVGITCGLKGFVGAVAHKDCLAHHRFGSPSIGGDEYPHESRLLHALSGYHDWVNARDQDRTLQGSFQIADKSIRRILRRIGLATVGAWSGNDTAWRMALDLARIVHYASRDGVMREVPQRRHLSFIDGIVGGEGNGPLSPRPVRSGVLLLSESVAVGDRVACRLMGYDPSRIPLIAHACDPTMPFKYPTVFVSDVDGRVCFNGTLLDEGELKSVLGRPFKAPSGWRNYFAEAG